MTTEQPWCQLWIWIPTPPRRSAGARVIAEWSTAMVRLGFDPELDRHDEC